MMLISLSDVEQLYICCMTEIVRKCCVLFVFKSTCISNFNSHNYLSIARDSTITVVCQDKTAGCNKDFRTNKLYIIQCRKETELVRQKKNIVLLVLNHPSSPEHYSTICVHRKQNNLHLPNSYSCLYLYHQKLCVHTAMC